MRTIEGQLKEIVDEMNYLKTREERFTKTSISANDRVQGFGICALTAGCMTDLPPRQLLQAQVSH
ncbi:hypothetical protein EST38_g12060 [Candolleomyces aberdarensis]|uniref:GOLD domain-containing protein n=1 Tax=Candolleomyces aberdarensis TaxID=2316362 RepID=A0A4Q2D3E5_9AGAR|nr:hypothetical protein EST38_g12060 [Candolleomyces aberdarensis]